MSYGQYLQSDTLTDTEIVEDFPDQIKSREPFVYQVDIETNPEYAIVRIAQYRGYRKALEVSRIERGENSSLKAVYVQGIVRCSEKYSHAEVLELGILDGVTLGESRAIFQRDTVVPINEESRKFPRQTNNNMVLTDELGSPIFRSTFVGKEGEEGELDNVINYVVSNMHIDEYLAMIESPETLIET